MSEISDWPWKKAFFSDIIEGEQVLSVWLTGFLLLCAIMLGLVSSII
jgi:hypothetical protein